MKKVAVILNLNKQYDRSIVSGIARFAKENKEWSLYIEDEPERKIPDFETWNGHGIIADLDDKTAFEKIKSQNIPIVGLGGGYLNTDESIPYVYTNNEAISKITTEHLYDCGFRNFAFCNIKPTELNGWANERCSAFERLINEKNCRLSIYEQKRNFRSREDLINSIVKWLEALPKPCGLMAANDSRARLVLEACRRADINVPEDIAVVGVDDDPLMCELSTPPLSSVIQGTDQLGYEASKLLNEMMNGNQEISSTIIAPQGLSIRQSSDIVAIEDDVISQALVYIRTNACNGIRVEDVSRHLDISRSNLEKKFKRLLNQSVHEKITSLKIKKAKELLISSSLPLKEIAFQSGFNNIQYMNKVIKDETGKTPKQFRLRKA